MSRLFFVAILPPEPIYGEVTAFKQDFEQRFNSRAALRSPPHITLQSPFKWPESDLSQLQNVLLDCARASTVFEIKLCGFAAFPPRVIYVNVQPSSSLNQLQAELSDRLERELQISDDRAKKRPFKPHMTVAFRDLARQNFKAAWPEFRDRAYDRRFLSAGLTLLIHDGSRWQVESTFAFPPVPNDKLLIE